MSDKNFLNGSKPFETHGYKPSANPPKVDTPAQGSPGAGYKPTISQGDSPGNPPKKP